MTKRQNATREIILFLGTSGSGKSTLISSLTNQQVHTSNKSNSCTKDSKLYSCKLNKSIHLLDTVGTEDTNGISTDEILKNICNKIGDKGHNIKIIWVITPNIKKTPQLQTQARFINCLNKNIWNSVIIICKMGMQPNDSQGAIEAAKNYTNNKLKAYNFHIYDIGEGWQSNLMYNMMSTRPINERTADDNFLLLKFDEVSKWLYNKTKDIKSLKIDMKKIHYHSPGYIEYKKHIGKFSIDKYAVMKNVGTGLAIGAGIGITGGLLGGAAGAGIVTLIGETVVVGEVGTVVGVTTGITTTGCGIISGVDSLATKAKKHVSKWDCCNEKNENAQGCRTFKKCVWCNKDDRTRGCRKSWVPKNYNHKPKRFLVRN